MIKDTLKTAVNGFKISLNAEMLERFETYARLLAEWNLKMNLTAITEPDEVAVKHFADCLEILNYVDIPGGASVIDVGTGAGFPGLVLKTARPDIKLTLLDSLNKRLVFLEEVLGALGLEAELVHGRGEDMAHKPEYRGQYDFAVSRAVARLNILAEYTLGFVKEGGALAALKGPSAGEEINESRRAVETLGGGNIKLFEYKLPVLNEDRAIVLIEKTGDTPEKFPRSSGKIKSKPL